MPARTGKRYSARSHSVEQTCPDGRIAFRYSTAYAAINRFRSTTCILISTAPRRRQDLAEDRHRPSRQRARQHRPRRSQAERPPLRRNRAHCLRLLRRRRPLAISQTNLPSTSIRDLVIHGDDIVVAPTAAPSGFLTTSRLCASSTPRSQVLPRICCPATHYRVRRNNNTGHSASA